MEKHMKTYRAHRALAILYAVVFVAVVAAVAIPMSSGKENIGDIPWGVFVAFAFIVAIFFLHWFVGGAAKQKKPWARVASIIIGIFALFGFPFGTIIGIYLLVNAIPEWDAPAQAAPGGS